MGYEDSVYLAKLAEQAERYEGMYSLPPPSWSAYIAPTIQIADCWGCLQRW